MTIDRSNECIEIVQRSAKLSLSVCLSARENPGHTVLNNCTKLAISMYLPVSVRVRVREEMFAILKKIGATNQLANLASSL